MMILSCFTTSAQPVNNSCGNAIALCPNQTISATNQGATATGCPNCEDDFSFCFLGTNSCWFTFTTNAAGGDVAINFSNLTFVIEPSRGTQLQAIIVEAAFPCDGSTYTQIGNCVMNAPIPFSLNATGLPPVTTYYIIVNGAMNGTSTLPAECSFDIIGSGTGFDRPPAAMGIGGPGTTICPQEPITFSAYLSDCTDTTSAFTWTVNGVVAAVIDDSPYFQISDLQDGDVVGLSCSCFSDCPQNLTANYGPFTVENIVVNAGADRTILPGESTLLVGSTNAPDYYWTPSANLANSTSLQTVAIPPVTTTYFLTAYSSTCTVSDGVVVTIKDQFVIPGSFSPNDDGANDKWIIQGIEAYPNALVTLYDRWGQQIEEIVGYSIEKAWNGTHNGKNVADGVYFFIVDLRDASKDEPFKGFVTVVR